jgi:hypothetical protein
VLSRVLPAQPSGSACKQKLVDESSTTKAFTVFGLSLAFIDDLNAVPTDYSHHEQPPTGGGGGGGGPTAAILITLLVLALLGGGGYAAYMKRDELKQKLGLGRARTGFGANSYASHTDSTTNNPLPSMIPPMGTGTRGGVGLAAVQPEVGGYSAPVLPLAAPHDPDAPIGGPIQSNM